MHHSYIPMVNTIGTKGKTINLHNGHIWLYV